MRHLVLDGANVGPVGPTLEQLKRPRASRPSTSGGQPPPPPNASAWLVALVTVAVMIRNVVISGLTAFAAGFLTSLGNVFSGKPSCAQTRVEFLAASMLWTQLLAFIAMLVALTIHLARVAPGSTQAVALRPSITYWCARMLQAVLLPYALASSVLIAFGWLCHRFVPALLDSLKIEYYMETLTYQVFFALCDARARHLYHTENTETTEGRRRSTTSRSNRASTRSAFRYFARAYLASVPTQAAVIVASVYVQVVSRWTFTSQRKLSLFLAGSLVFKLVTQEIIKLFLLTHGSPSLCTMCVLVSVPTVIIDTQVRVVILSVASLQSSLTGSFILAAAEILMRGAKVLLLRLAIRHRRRVTDASHVAAFAAWHLQQVRYHTAETILTCTPSIVPSCARLPSQRCGQGILSTLKGSKESNQRRCAQRWRDKPASKSVSIMRRAWLEIAAGAALDTRGNGFGTFLGFVFLMLVIVNMNISAMLYIQSRRRLRQL